MSGPLILSGTQFYVCASQPAANALAQFQLLNFTQVRGVRSIGDFEKQWQTRVDQAIGSNSLIKNKRTHYIYPDVLIDMLRINDAGQALLLSGADSNNAFSFKVLHTDGTGLFFSAIVNSRKAMFGESSSTLAKGISLALESDPIEF